MTSPTFVTQLKQQIPSQSWQTVLLSLRQDPFIWNQLEKTDLGVRALNELPSQVESWSPASLALLDMHYLSLLESMLAEPLEPVSPPLRRMANRAFLDWRNHPEDAVQSLAQMGLLAIALRERRLNQSWEEVFTETGVQVCLNSPDAKTVLACLFGMQPASLPMVRALLEGVPARIDLALHALLSNPLSNDALEPFCSQLLADLPSEIEVSVLEKLAIDRPWVAAHLAENVAQQALPSTSNPIERLALDLRKVRLQKLSGTPSKVINSLSETIKTARELQAAIAADLGKTAAKEKDTETALEAWRQANRLNPQNNSYAAGLALAMLDAGRRDDAQAFLYAREAVVDENEPDLSLAYALLSMARGETKTARNFALESAKSLDRLDFDRIARLSRLLFELDLTEQAADTTRQALYLRPNEIDLLELLAQAELSQGKTVEASLAAELALINSPSNPGLRRLLIRSLEAAENWEAALEERQALLAEISNGKLHQTMAMHVEDLRGLASCAIRSGKPERAMEACQDALVLDPEDGLIYELLGKSQLALGDTQAALEAFSKATTLTPHAPGPWLAYAEARNRLGEHRKSVELLRAAAQAVPESPEIHLALGEAYLQEEAFTQALPCLQQADTLAAHNRSQSGYAKQRFSEEQNQKELSARISLRLGTTLLRLGHVEESCEVLEKAYHSSPTDLDIAQAAAHALLAFGKVSEALPPLAAVVQANPGEPEPSLTYAQALLEVPGNNYEQAQSALPLLEMVMASEKATQDQKEKSQALLAEALLTTGELEGATAAFTKALETPFAQDPVWRARLNLGLGKAALELEQYETSLAALQEAAHIDPTNPRIHHSLSEAFLATNLLEEAFESARECVRLDPTNLETLVWFARQAQYLPAQGSSSHSQTLKEGIEALQRANQLAPQRGDLALRLGEIQMDAGNRAEALDNLARLGSEEATPVCSVRDLKQAASFALSLDESQLAIQLLERAISAAASDEEGEAQPNETSSLADLWKDLANLYHRIGDLPAALEALDQSISSNPQEASLYLQKGDLLIEAGDQQATLLVLESGLEAVQAAGAATLGLHQKIAFILRKMGRLNEALAHAVQAMDEEGPAISGGAYQAVEIARSLLLPGRALNLVETHRPGVGSPATSIYSWLQTELNMEAGDDQAAASSLTVAQELAQNHPRTLAAQSRLAARKGDLREGQKIWQRAIDTAEEDTIEAVATQRAIGLAALDLGYWVGAIQVFQNVVETAPLEPLSHLQLAQALVLRAESQRLSQSLDVIQHAPGKEALSDEAYHLFQNCIETAERLSQEQWLLEENSTSNASELHQDRQGVFPVSIANQVASIARWQARGEAAFRPGPESIRLLEKLPPAPDVVAALVSSLGGQGDIVAARRAAQAFPQHPWVLLHLALALGKANSHHSLGIAETAVEALSNRDYDRPHEIPLRHFLLARLAHYSGDYSSARQAVQVALDAWPDEPRWHALAAEMYRQDSKTEGQPALVKAIHHLERATRLEPKHISHYLALGQAYHNNGEHIRAIQAFEQAARIAPEQSEPWLFLANVQRQIGDLNQAAIAAERAIERAQDPTDALLLRGEIALQAQNPNSAYSHAQAVLKSHPEHPAALQLLAQALQGLHRPEEALAALEKALPLVDKPLPLLLKRASLLKAANGLEPAIEAWQDLANHYPNEAEVLAPLAEALMEAGRVQAAIDVTKQALQAEEGALASDVQANLHFLLGRQARRTGQLDQAIYHLNQAVQHAPQHIEAYMELGHTHHERRQYSQALVAYRQAIQVSGKDSRPYYHAALALKESKDYAGAEKMLRRAAELAPTDVTIHRLLGAVVALNLVHSPRLTSQE